MKRNREFLRITAAAFTASILLLSACKKKEDDSSAASPSSVTTTPTTSTKVALLSDKNWKLTAWTSNPAIIWSVGGSPITNIFAATPTCQIDDYVQYKTNNTYTTDFKTLCGGETSSSGTWVFASNETKLLLNGGTADSSSVSIVQLDATTLKYTSTFKPDSITHLFTFTFTKQ